VQIPARRSRAELLAAIAVIVVAALLRFDTLGARPLWSDERAVAAFVAQAEREGFARASSPAGPKSPRTEAQLSPLHVALAYASAHRFGGSPAALRLPSVLAGVATAALVIALGRALWGGPVGLVAGALFAISPYQIEYAQDARSYALFVALATAQLGAWLLFLQTRRGAWLVAFAVAGAASLYAHHLALVNQAALAALAGATALRGRIARDSANRARAFTGREAGLVALAFAAIALLYLPQLPNARGFLRSGVANALVVLAPSPRFVHELAGRWGCGRGAAAWLYEAAFVAGVFSGWRTGRPVLALLAWILCPIVVFSVVPFSKFFDLRYLMAGQPAFLQLVAAGAVACIEEAERRLRSSAPAHARTASLALASLLLLAFAVPAARAHLSLRRLPLRCSEFFLEPRILDLASGACRRYLVLNTLVPEDRYLLRVVASAAVDGSAEAVPRGPESR
jgi:mannosyltransferase